MRKLRFIGLAALLALGAGSARADLVIGSTVTSDSVYNNPGIPSINGTGIFTPAAAAIVDPGVEFSALDKDAQMGAGGLVQTITADLSASTITIAFHPPIGVTTDHGNDPYHFRFSNLTVADGASITGLTLLSNQSILVDSTSFTANSLEIDLGGYLNGSAQGLDSITYRIDFSTPTIAAPEPSTVALAVSAVPVGIAVAWRRRRRSAA